MKVNFTFKYSDDDVISIIEDVGGAADEEIYDKLLDYGHEIKKKKKWTKLSMFWRKVEDEKSISEFRNIMHMTADDCELKISWIDNELNNDVNWREGYKVVFFNQFGKMPQKINFRREKVEK